MREMLPAPRHTRLSNPIVGSGGADGLNRWSTLSYTESARLAKSNAAEKHPCGS